MKSSVVPAQITTIEDKIASNLSPSQLALVTIPLFVACMLYVILPPFFSLSDLKLFLFIMVSLVCIFLALRIKEKLIIEWVKILATYNLRPRFYVANKNDNYLREKKKIRKKTHITEREYEKNTKSSAATDRSLTTHEILKAHSILANPAITVHFKTNGKGDWNVFITEVE